MPDDSASTPIQKTVADNFNQLSSILGNPIDLNVEFHGIGNSIGIAYLDSLINEKDIKTDLLTPLLQILTGNNPSIDQLAGLLPQTGSRRLDDLEAAASDLLEGRTLIFLEAETCGLSFKTPGWLKREPLEPEGEKALRGPREGFTETLSDNIGMIRRWVADHHLRADQLQIGRRTKTNIAVMYLDDVAAPRLVKEVKKRITAIDIDGVIESSYLELSIKDRRASLFPLTQSTERTDKATAAILEGRVAILVDKSPFVILVPVTLDELYHAADDYYLDFWVASLLRLFRLLGNILAVGLPGLYVALYSVNPELLPTQFALTLAGSRAHIAFTLPIEVILVELVVGIFLEAGVRLPGLLNQTVGIVFGVLLALAGVFSGLVSLGTVIVIALSAVASFAGPNFAIGQVWRFLKYIMLLAASFFGFFGLTIAGVLILAHAADLNSFGVSYMAPWAPLEWPELGNAPVRAPFWSRWNRPKTYRPQDRLRSGGTKREDDEND